MKTQEPASSQKPEASTIFEDRRKSHSRGQHTQERRRSAFCDSKEWYLKVNFVGN